MSAKKRSSRTPVTDPGRPTVSQLFLLSALAVVFGALLALAVVRGIL